MRLEQGPARNMLPPIVTVGNVARNGRSSYGPGRHRPLWRGEPYFGGATGSAPMIPTAFTVAFVNQLRCVREGRPLLSPACRRGSARSELLLAAARTWDVPVGELIRRNA